MRSIRTEAPQPEIKWDVEDVMAYLSCDETQATKIMKDCRSKHGIGGYDAIEKHLILDFINEKQRVEREREARYNADIATTRQVAILEEQVKTLKEQITTLREANLSSSSDARKARTQSLIANFISLISVAIAIIALVLKLV